VTARGGGARGTFARFLVVGVLSVGVDTAALVVLRELVGLPLALATTLAFALTLAVNFSLNMGFVFGVSGRLAGRLTRYAVLVVVNYALTLLLVLGIAALCAHYVAAKLIAVACCALLNFAAYRHWVFV
jgi:putative flippase GtrA